MRPTLAIMFGVAIAASKLISPPWIAATSSSEPTTSRQLFSLASLLALGEDGHADGLAGAMRQGDGAANVLVGLTGVDAQTEVGLNGLVKLGGSDLLHQADSSSGL